MTETIFTNARIVLPNAVIEGSVVVAGARIAAVAEGRSAFAGALDRVLARAVRAP